MLNGLDLFSGIGGISLALREWVKPVAYCEIETYAAGVLFSRMLDGSIPTAPIFPDITKLTGKILPSIDIIYGGFPCQDVSDAGLRKGLDGERTGLFREAVRLIRECKPKFVFFENVRGIRQHVFRVRQELEEVGYDCRDGFLSAADVGASHIRQRWWLLANLIESGTQARLSIREKERLPTSRNLLKKEAFDTSFREKEPEYFMGRMVDGVPFRVDRIRGLGNSVVPIQAREAFKILMGLTHKDYEEQSREKKTGTTKNVGLYT